MSVVKEKRRPSDQRIRSQLDRILEHPEFQATEKMREFLRFVVEETLAGHERQLKGFTIATEVFGRDQDFDAAHDPVVRIQAGRLRRALERYYLVAGMDDPVFIDIPKGGYVPVFTEPSAKPQHATGAQSMSETDPAACWPSVLVCPFEDHSGRTDLAYLASGLATELCMELASIGDLRVMLFTSDFQGLPEERSTPDFMVQGNIRAEGAMIKAVVQLIVPRTGELLWTESLKSELRPDHLIEFQEKTAAVIAAHIAGQHGAIFRTMTSDASEKPSAYGRNYEAILKGYAYHQRITPDSFTQAFEALQKANAEMGNCGLVSSMLAILYVDNISLAFFDVTKTPLQEAHRLSMEGVQLQPGNQFCRIALARVHLLNDDLEAGLREIETIQALAPDSVLFMDAIGYLSTLFGDWERGERLVRRAIQLNPHYRLLTRYATWLNAFRQEDYDRARRETRWLSGIGFFWDPLSRAATFGQMGKLDEGRVAVRQLLEMKPDFPQRGHTFISHYIKFPEIRRQVIEGLAASGLDIDADSA